MTKYMNFYVKLLHRRIFNIRNLILLGILWLTEDMMLQQIIALGVKTGEKITPAAYVFLQSYAGFLLILFLEAMVFYTDAPFITYEQLYVVLRTGKTRWYFDQIVYIVVSSLMILLTTAFLCIVRLFPVIKFSLSWDRILGTFALTDAGQQFEVVLPVPYKILNRYEPIEAMGYSLLAGWGILCFIGMCMFVISLLRNRKEAVIITTVMILIFGIQDYYPAWIRYIVPLSWMQITELGVRYSEFSPTQKYVSVALPVILGVLTAIGFWSVNKADFEWIEEE